RKFYRINKLEESKSDDKPGDSSEPLDEEDHVERSHAEMIHKWIWRDFINIILGFWLFTNALTMGYFESSPRLAWNDLICGLAIVVLGVMTLFPRFDLARWGICFIGVWLMFAPLIFWTPSAGA